ncbi:MAG: VIT1/CCC1 transporter family protein [Anaerolineaceae bacterium]|nr:VIT1/CCC1 transporter family protein [Anaerolineaceae bacterium]
MKEEISGEVRETLIFLQQDEINSYHVYLNLAKQVQDEHNSETLKKIAKQEMHHYQLWKEYTGKDLKPQGGKVRLFTWIARIFGLTFGVKLMELGEEAAQEAYSHILDRIPEARVVMEEEEVHEQELLDMIDEESLKYAGSVVLGLNDALVELTGALAGLTLAFQDTKLIALTGLITGISASFSMAASEYLSQRNEMEAGEEATDPIKSAIYTGLAYVVTVAILILPYLLFQHYLVALGFTILNAIMVIAIFNYYISVAKSLKFKRRFLEMAAISLGVALLSFFVGYLVNTVFGLEV